MKLRSTRDPNVRASWKDAVLSGIAPDGGLYTPVSLPRISHENIAKLRHATFAEVAAFLTHAFVGDELSSETIQYLCSGTWDFELPLKELSDSTYILELFHGPTCAFKDFGARFMAKLFRHFWGNTGKPLTVLVATSGDTGSAVANAFFDPSPAPPIQVAILYPRDKVSDIQRKQMTTLGHNVTAFEVAGTFDDCQALVKQALGDKQLLAAQSFTSANSINIARLLPQMFYYAYATLQLPETSPPVFIVPSGNLGNLTGALLAHLSGFVAHRCVAACNSNKTFSDFLASGSYQPRPSHETLSNAMDVGAPSNFFRINALMGQEREDSIIRPEAPTMRMVSAYSASDTETKAVMKLYDSRYGYIVDPHTGVGAAALEDFKKRNPTHHGPLILVATAHPAKFPEVVEQAIGTLPAPPEQLRAVLEKQELRVPLSNDYTEFSNRLLSLKHSYESL